MGKRILRIGMEVALFILAAGVLFGQTPPKSKPVEKAPDKPVAQQPAKQDADAAIKDPSPEWIKQYEDLVALAGVIDKMKAEYGIDRLEYELKKQSNVLGAQVPAGYNFDVATKKFVKIVAPAPEPKK